MQNQLIDLNNHLFALMERLGDEQLSGEDLGHGLNRTKAMTGIAKEIISNAQLALDAEIAAREGLVRNTPAMIGCDK